MPDSASAFARAHKKQYAAKGFLHKDPERTGRIHMVGSTNNNNTTNNSRMESFNGNAQRTREKAVRGVKLVRFVRIPFDLAYLAMGTNYPLYCRLIV